MLAEKTIISVEITDPQPLLEAGQAEASFLQNEASVLPLEPFALGNSPIQDNEKSQKRSDAGRDQMSDK